MSDLIIFDLDGVITSEEAYWDAAGLTLHELCFSPRYWELDQRQLGADGKYHPAATAWESRRISRAIFPESEILALKARAINSNWDTCYVTVCLHLIDLLKYLQEQSQEPKGSLLTATPLSPLRPWDADWNATFRKQIARAKEQASQEDLEEDHPLRHVVAGLAPARWAWHPQGVPLHVETDIGVIARAFESPIFSGVIGLELINRFDAYASEVLGYSIEGVFSRYSPFWTFCQNIFQEWYLGDELYRETYGHEPAQTEKPGCIHFEHPLLPLEQVRTTLQALREQRYVPGFATGRVRREAFYPLQMYGLLQFFDDHHISTYDDVEDTEVILRAHGDQTLLSKPHPFPFLVAVDRNYKDMMTQSLAPASDAVTWHPRLTPPHFSPASSNDLTPFIVVGDSTSDILGGRAAGALTVAVLTGARTPEARALLAESGPDFTINDMTKLPSLLAHIDDLATIQRLQFTEREKAERLLRHWFARRMNLVTGSVTLRPKAVSLNSFNGFYSSDGEEYFFKTHVEEQGVLEEYYYADLLYKAGYNIVRPLRTMREKGRQMVIYPVVHWPVMFDLLRAVETDNPGEISLQTLVLAEQQECNRLLSIYQSTLAFSAAEEHAREPIHQLFWHRLSGARFKNFYEGKSVPFPIDQDTQAAVHSIPFDELLDYHWVINAEPQERTLGELVDRAKVVLYPARSYMTIVGHGDAHFGNVFLEGTGQDPRYLYFDPAFAGRHSPLFDVIKPLYHNVFATWMYFPQDIAQHLQLSVSAQHKTVFVEHNYALTPARLAIVRTKTEHLLRPLIAWLRSQNALPGDWLEIIQLALMCCPLLTINLLDGERMPVAISWLGLSQAVQMGNNGIEAWRNGI